MQVSTKQINTGDLEVKMGFGKFTRAVSKTGNNTTYTGQLKIYRDILEDGIQY